MDIFYLVLPVLMIFVLLPLVSTVDRPVLFMFGITSLYYAVGGPIYWVVVRFGYFIGVYWGRDEIYSAAAMLGWSSFATCFLYIIFIRGFDVIFSKYSDRLTYNSSVFNWNALVVLGVLGCLGAIYTGVSVLAAGGFNEGDKFLLIAYQFSDLLVPVLLAVVGLKVQTRFKVLCVLGFVAYAMILGFRYKVILMVVPILSYVYYSNGAGSVFGVKVSPKIQVVIAGLLSVVCFSLLTLTRTKFEGVDFSAIKSQSGDDTLYGFFAESNIIFGLLSILNEFVDVGRYIGFSPFYSAVEEWLPRFMYPGKQTSSYMQDVLAGLIADEGMRSGTAYPFVGEYLMMGGYLSCIVGLFFLALFIMYFRIKLYRSGVCDEHKYIGAGLLAVYFGYYYYSRGFMPQAIKGVAFVIVPYFIIVARKVGLR